MNNPTSDHTDLANELLVGYHLQFAENQRIREQSFLKIVSFLGAVVFAYAYVYHNLQRESGDLLYAAVAAISLLSIGSAVVTVIAYNFRRDQYVITRIRRMADIIGLSKPFPPDYTPIKIVNENGFLSWMPDLFNVFYIVFPLFQILVLLSFYEKLGIHLSARENCDINITISIIASIACIAISFALPYYYYRKLKRKLREWEKEYDYDIGLTKG